MMRPGDVLQDRYEIVRYLKRGGMGSIYEALDRHFECSVAVKQCNSLDPVDIEAFRNESRLLMLVRHPALPVAHDCFEELGRNFIVMDYVWGSDLEELSQDRRFSFDEVQTWTIELLDVLENLHTRYVTPVIHRDVKPSNIKLPPSGKLMLVDFGIAKGAIHEGTIVHAHTPHYSPIEQTQHLTTGVRSDLYSLGATVYFLLTAAKPADAKERSEAISAGAADPLQPIDRFRDDVPANFVAAISRALQVSADHRPGSVAELRSLLQQDATAAPADITIPSCSYFNSGLQLYKENNFVPASHAFMTSIRQGSRMTDSWYWFGLSKLSLAGIDSASEDFREKLKSVPATVTIEQRRILKNAADAFDNAISNSLLSIEDESRSTCVRAHCWSGLISVTLRRYLEAKRSFINAIHLRPRWSEPRLCLIEVYRLMNRPSAVGLHERFLKKLDPGALGRL